MELELALGSSALQLSVLAYVVGLCSPGFPSHIWYPGRETEAGGGPGAPSPQPGLLWPHSPGHPLIVLAAGEAEAGPGN